MTIWELILCCAAGAALLGGSLGLERQGKRLPALGSLGCACLAPVWCGYRGMDFSPSFTMYFVLFQIVLCTAGELLRAAAGASRSAGIARGAGTALFCTGVVFSFPAVFIYATGADRLDSCIPLAAALSSAICGARLFLLWKKNRAIQAGGELALWLTLTAACMTLLCAVESAALWPCGAGLLCLAVSGTRSNTLLRRGLFWTGLTLCSLFAAVPALAC